MQQWALINPEDELITMSTSRAALEEILEGFEDYGVGWSIVRADPGFFAERPELQDWAVGS